MPCIKNTLFVEKVVEKVLPTYFIDNKINHFLTSNVILTRRYEIKKFGIGHSQITVTNKGNTLMYNYEDTPLPLRMEDKTVPFEKDSFLCMKNNKKNLENWLYYDKASSFVEIDLCPKNKTDKYLLIDNEEVENEHNSKTSKNKGKNKNLSSGQFNNVLENISGKIKRPKEYSSSFIENPTMMSKYEQLELSNPLLGDAFSPKNRLSSACPKSETSSNSVIIHNHNSSFAVSPQKNKYSLDSSNKEPSMLLTNMKELNLFKSTGSPTNSTKKESFDFNSKHNNNNFSLLTTNLESGNHTSKNGHIVKENLNDKRKDLVTMIEKNENKNEFINKNKLKIFYNKQSTDFTTGNIISSSSSNNINSTGINNPVALPINGNKQKVKQLTTDLYNNFTDHRNSAVKAENAFVSKSNSNNFNTTQLQNNNKKPLITNYFNNNNIQNTNINNRVISTKHINNKDNDVKSLFPINQLPENKNKRKNIEKKFGFNQI